MGRRWAQRSRAQAPPPCDGMRLLLHEIGRDFIPDLFSSLVNSSEEQSGADFLLD